MVEKLSWNLPTGKVQKIVFPDFVLTNKYPDNVFVIVGSTFKVKENACVRPYLSSDYNTFIVSKLDGLFGEWNWNNLLCKMYTVPYKLGDYSKLPDITMPHVSNIKWFTTPIRHTL